MTPPIEFATALKQLLDAGRALTRHETVSLFDADGRVLALPLHAAMAVPSFDNSAMDGYALNVADFDALPATWPVAQRIAAGEEGVALAANSAARIFTGAPIPPGCNAVVPQEETAVSDDMLRLLKPPSAGQHIRRIGEDIEAGRAILAAGRRLQPQDLSLAASVGIARATVWARLKVGVLFTGSELALPGEPLKPGAIYNSNRFALTAQLRRLGCVVRDYGNVPDDLAATKTALALAASENHVIITSGGVSVGEEDHVRTAVLAQGSLQLWRIAMKPGKPLAFGQIGDAAFIGLPGNPVSAFITFCLLARPFLLQAMGASADPVKPLYLPAAFAWPRPDMRREFLRARLLYDASGEARVAIYPQQGSAIMSGVVWADGLVDIPPGCTVAQGDRVPYLPFSSLS